MGSVSLVGRRIEGEVFVYDYPGDGNGRRYFVESGFESKLELAVLLADYRRQAERLGACPMSREATERVFELAHPRLAGAPHGRTLRVRERGHRLPHRAGARTKEHS